MMDVAGIEKPNGLPGRSVLPLALGNSVDDWRECLVAQNHLAQTEKVDGIKPTMEGRMVRTARFKYCLYSHGEWREALYDLQSDPLEMINVAQDPDYRRVLLSHRATLEKYAAQHNDQLATELLKNDVEPRPFK